MEPIALQMKLEKITKNTVRYSAFEGSLVDTVYISKDAFPDVTSDEQYPQDIELVITEV